MPNTGRSRWPVEQFAHGGRQVGGLFGVAGAVGQEQPVRCQRRDLGGGGGGRRHGDAAAARREMAHDVVLGAGVDRYHVMRPAGRVRDDRDRGRFAAGRRCRGRVDRSGSRGSGRYRRSTAAPYCVAAQISTVRVCREPAPPGRNLPGQRIVGVRRQTQRRNGLRGHPAHQVQFTELGRLLRFPDQRIAVQVDRGNHPRLGAVQAQVAGQRARVHLVDADDAVFPQVTAQVAGGAPVGVARCQLAHDQAARPRLARLRVVLVDPVVADQRIGQAHQLTRVGGIGEDLLVAGHRRVEHHLAGHLAVRADRPARERRAILQCQPRTPLGHGATSTRLGPAAAAGAGNPRRSVTPPPPPARAAPAPEPRFAPRASVPARPPGSRWRDRSASHPRTASCATWRAR